MITKQTAFELAGVGGRYRASYLIPQAGYTLGIAIADGDALAALLPPGFLDEVARLRDDLDKARQDKAAIVQPVPDVMAMQEAGVGATGEAATMVAELQGPANGGRNGSGAAADGHRRGVVTGRGHQGAIAGDAPERFRGKRGSVFQGGRQHAVRGQGVLVHVDHHLVAVGSGALAAVAGQVVGGQGDHAVGSGGPGGRFAGRFRGKVGVRRLLLWLAGGAGCWRFRGNLAGAIHGAQDQIGLVGGEHDLELHHAAGQQSLAHAAVLGHAGAVLLHGASVAAADSFELRPGGRQGQVEQPGFVGGGGDAGQRPDFGVGELADPQCLVNPRQLSKRVRHAHLLTGGAEVEPNPPGQPMGTRDRALRSPAARLVELANAL